MDFLISIFSIIIYAIIQSNHVTVSSCLGCIELDKLTFDKIIEKFEYTLVKFDIAFPYGEKHEAFGAFASETATKYPNLLTALVGIKDYGEKENMELGKFYDVNDKNLPVIMLFSNMTIKSKKPLAHWTKSNEINIENIKKFVKDNTGIYLALDGCLKLFDMYAKQFIIANVDEKKNIYNQCNDAIKLQRDQKDEKNAKVYVKYMEKIIENGNKFLVNEQKRLTNILKGKINAKNKLDVEQKMNILKSFQIDTKHEEL